MLLAIISEFQHSKDIHPNLYTEILKQTKRIKKKQLSHIVIERPPIQFKTNFSFTVTKIVKRYVKHYRLSNFGRVNIKIIY